VATKDAGFTAKGIPYQMKFTDDLGNAHVRYAEWPDIISRFFGSHNTNNKHNQCHQAESALKKHWQTQNAFFHLHTTIGVNVGDCYLLADHHRILNYRIPGKEYKISIIYFARILAHRLICNVDSLISLYIPLPQEFRSFLADGNSDPYSISILAPESTSTLTAGEKIFCP
jgi:hypothetical protein